MFGSSAEESAGRYKFEMISGQLRKKSHENEVQQALNEGANRGWELINASLSAGSGGYYSTGLFWDTSPRR